MRFFSTASKPCPSHAHQFYNLPPGHPAVEPHKHDQGTKCPIADAKGEHAYCPPQEGDSRAVCPALNTLANHGYIPRHGKNLTAPAIMRGLKECYGITYPLGTILSFGGFALVWRPFHSLIGGLTLYDICRHMKCGGTEHDASLVHENTPLVPVTDVEEDGKKETKEKKKSFPPMPIIKKWVTDLLDGSFPPMPIIKERVMDLLDDILPPIDKRTKEAFRDAWAKEDLETAGNLVADVLVNDEDIARARIRREKESAAFTQDTLKATSEKAYKKAAKKAEKKGKQVGDLCAFHAKIARGEIAIILAMWERVPADGNGKKGVPLIYFLTFLQYETLPTIAIPGSTTTPNTPNPSPPSTQSKRKSLLNTLPFLSKAPSAHSPEPSDDEKNSSEKVEAQPVMVPWTSSKKITPGDVGGRAAHIETLMDGMREKAAKAGKGESKDA